MGDAFHCADVMRDDVEGAGVIKIVGDIRSVSVQQSYPRFPPELVRAAWCHACVTPRVTLREAADFTPDHIILACRSAWTCLPLMPTKRVAEDSFVDISALIRLIFTKDACVRKWAVSNFFMMFVEYIKISVSLALCLFCIRVVNGYIVFKFPMFF